MGSRGVARSDLIGWLAIWLFVGANACAANWPQWRGPDSTGVAVNASPPIQWSDTENVRWKTALPGRGHSTPIIWGDHVFVTTAIPVGQPFAPRRSNRPGAHDNLPVTRAHRFAVIAIDRKNGNILWEKSLHESIPREGGHATASLASASPVTDGKNVYAYFGSHGLYCLNFAGDIVWQKQFGKMHTKHGHGEGTSPALHERFLVINWDHEEQSFLAVLDKTTGQEIWRRDRQEVTSWATPLIVEVDGAEVDGAMQTIVCGTDRVRGYDLESGEVVWECGGMSANIVATPVAAAGMVYVASSYEKRVLMAIRLKGARGDITATNHVVWSRTRGTPYVPSPLLYHGSLYFLTHYQNVLTRVNAQTGENAPGSIRLGDLGNIYASPVGAAGHVFLTDLHGTTQVITNGEVPRTVAVNRLGESVNASAAIVSSEIFLRGDQHLYCIAED
jgi:outer membrane protein assembly factor BamB